MHDNVICCNDCCHCRFGNDVQCPFYKGHLENTDIITIKRGARKEKEIALYWASCLLFGHRTEKNERKAVAVLSKLVRKQYVPAVYLLSLCYFNGLGVSQNTENAFMLCEVAAMKGCNLAEIKLYECYQDGVGITQDFEKAKEWCGNAAHHKSDEMYFKYAEMCSSPQYGTPNLKTACEFFERALAAGNELALTKIVELHKVDLAGCFGGQKPKEGADLARYYRELGDFCLDNKYVPNVQEAILYYKKSLAEERNIIQRSEDDQKTEHAVKATKYAEECRQNLLKDYGMKGFSTREKSEQNIKILTEKMEKAYEKYFAECAGEVEKNTYTTALSGDATVQYEMGLLFDNEDFALYDSEQAVKWYGLSAQQGYAKAQYQFGYAHYYGDGIEQNCEEAVKWFRLAAEQGELNARASLGICYYNGDGVNRDYEEAVKWLRPAAERGVAKAQACLGQCYYNGNGLKEDVDEAFKWFLCAAEQGHEEAQTDVGLCYYFGYGVDQNYKEAAKWFRLSADQNTADGQLNLGACYSEGYGVEQDDAEAVKWFSLAAQQGNARAQYNLGVHYFYGKGVEQSYQEAKKWFLLSAQGGYEGGAEAVEECEEEIKNSTPIKSYSSNLNFGSDKGTQSRFDSDQVTDYGVYLEKQLSGTLTAEERDAFDRRWGW